MKIEITLSAYMFPLLLAIFKSLGIGRLVQWWRSVSKRHFSYAKVAKHSVADATINVDLYWLVGLYNEPVSTIKIGLFYVKINIKWALYVFAIPWQLAYLTIIAWILKLYIWVMDTLQSQDNADWGAPISEVIAYFTPGGLWEAYCAYAYDEVEVTIIKLVDSGTTIGFIIDDCKGPSEVADQTTEGADDMAEFALSLEMTPAEKDLCQAINDGPAIPLDLVLTDMCLPNKPVSPMNALEQALVDSLNEVLEFVPVSAISK